MNSRSVVSSQKEVHSDLERVVKKHLRSSYLRPIGAPTREAFEALLPILQEDARPLVLDSGCGTGESTARLATMYPDHFVLGVDKSAHRLGKKSALQIQESGRNCLLVRADLVDFWRLLEEHAIKPTVHHHLYPNPWPKPGHLQRRWHGHGVFSTLVKLGGRVEMRSNWPIYLQEFALSWGWATGVSASVEPFTPAQPLTPFERKYHHSGQPLFRLVIPHKATQE